MIGLLICACATPGESQILNNSDHPVTQQTRDAAGRPDVMMSEKLEASRYKLSIGTSIRADQTEAETTNAARSGELAEESVRIAQANGATGYVVLDDHTLVKSRVRKVLKTSATEPTSFIREWVIEIGDASVPRRDGRSWVKVP